MKSTVKSSVKFSVIIPTFNRAQLILKTVQSVIDQTYDNFEVIIVDDGSTDDTEKLFLTYHHPNVRYFRKQNGERGAARNFGAKLATGDYFNFFDSDDLLLSNHLDEALKCIETYNQPEVFTVGFRIEDSNGKIKQTIDNLPDPLNNTLLRGNVLGCNPVFIKRDVFEKNPFDETRALAGSEDWLLWLKLAARYDFRYWNKVTCVLVDHEGRSVYNFKEEKLVARTEVMMAQLSDDPVFMNRYGSELKKIHAFRHIYTGLHLALSGQMSRPIFYLCKAAAISPTSLFRKATIGTLKHVVISGFKKLNTSSQAT